MLGWLLLGGAAGYGIYLMTREPSQREKETSYKADRILSLLNFPPMTAPSNSIMTVRVLVPTGMPLPEIQRLFTKADFATRLRYGAQVLPQVALIESRVPVPPITTNMPELYVDVVDARAQTGPIVGDNTITQEQILKDLGVEPISGKTHYQLAAALYQALAILAPKGQMDPIPIGIRDVEPLPMGKMSGLAGARFLRGW